MAFISAKHKLAFIHVPKTGGTSITHALAAAHHAKLTRPFEHYAHNGVGQDIPAQFKPDGITVHDPWSEIIRKHPAAKAYKPVAVVRNPWERIYSFYWHKRRRRDRDLPLNPRTAKPYSLADTFKVSNVLLLQPQVWWFPESAHVILFERMPESLCQIGCGLPDVPIMRLNTRPEGKSDWRKAFDPYTRDLIFAYYRYEIEKYGFTF